MTAQKFPKMWAGPVGVLILIVVLIPIVPAQDMMYRYDAGHTGDYSPVAGVTGSNVSQLWSTSTDDKGDFMIGAPSPALANSTLYAISVHGDLLAFNATTGKEQWNASIFVYRSSPAVTNGSVYVGSYNGNVYALNAVTGKILWTYPTGNPIDSSAVVANDTLYISSPAGTYMAPDETLYALNGTTGEKIWSFPIGGSSVTSPAVENGTIFIGGDSGRVYALRADTGRILWSVSIDGAAGSSPMVKNGIIYISSTAGSFYALNETTGERVWKFTMDTSNRPALTISNNTVYISNRQTLYAINATTGMQIWNTTANRGFTSPIVANGVIYICDSVNLYAFDIATGIRYLIWKFPDDNRWANGELVIENGTLYGEMYYNTEMNPAGFTPYYKNTVFALDLNAGPSGVPLQPVTPALTASPSTTASPANTLAPSTGLPLAIPGIALPAVIAIVLVLRQRKQRE